MKTLDEDKSGAMIVKSNRLIEASYRLNLIEQQIILYSIWRSREDGTAHLKDEPITIEARDFAATFGIKSSNVYTFLKEAVSTLFERKVMIHDIHPETGKPRRGKTRWVSDIAYVDGEGLVQFTFAPKVRPYIARLEGHHTKYALQAVVGMTSGHAIRLYELLAQYTSIGERPIQLVDLKDKLGIPGEYKAIKDFKIRVLDLAVEQINTHSDLRVSYTQTKTGKAITGFIFTIKKKVTRESRPSKRPIVDEAYVKKHARPGESYDQAYRRLLEEIGQQRLSL